MSACAALSGALLLGGCIAAETGGGGGPVPDGDGSDGPSGVAGQAVEVPTTWEDLDGLNCAELDPQVWVDVLEDPLQVTCSPGNPDGVLEGTVRVQYTPFCNSGPVYVTVTEISVALDDGLDTEYPIQTAPLASPILSPGGAVVGDHALTPVVVPGVCGACDSGAFVMVKYGTMPHWTHSYAAVNALECTE